MEDVILVANSLSSKGRKIVTFLKNNGRTVYGVDRFESPQDNPADKYFRLDLRHKESVTLLANICKPQVVIYCWDKPNEADEFTTIDYAPIALNNLLVNLVSDLTDKVILCVEKDGYGNGYPSQATEAHLITLTEAFIRELKIGGRIITNEENLLKTIKQEIKLEGGDD